VTYPEAEDERIAVARYLRDDADGWEKQAHEVKRRDAADADRLMTIAEIVRGYAAAIERGEHHVRRTP
jgi:hypothetical protein